MSGRGLRWMCPALLATAGASLLGLTSMMHSAFTLGADTALILTPSGFPIPPQSYLHAVDNLYLDPNGFAAYTPKPWPLPRGCIRLPASSRCLSTRRSSRASQFSIAKNQIWLELVQRRPETG